MARKYKAGERFEIKLKESPGTGYSWHLNDAADPDERVVKMISSDFAGSEKAGSEQHLVGGYGTRTFVFEAVRSGTFELVSQPPGRHDASANEVASYSIKVKGGAPPSGETSFATKYVGAVAVLGGVWLLSKIFKP